MPHKFYPSLRPVRKTFLTGLSLTGLILFLIVPLAYAELENFQAADVVLGQPDFSQNAANNGNATPSASSIFTPNTIFSDGRRLFVADSDNNRILIWNHIPTTNFASADVVLGQPDFTQNAANNGGVLARSLNFPVGVFSDGKRLFVTDFSNNRILIWNTIPKTNFAPADVVLGQPDFAQNTANNGGISARSLSSPARVFSDGKRFFAVDRTNQRILIWNTIPTVNFAPADVVLGQPNFTQNTADNGGVSSRSVRAPNGIFSDGKRLFVAVTQNRRILIWNTIPTTNFAPADVVLGQPDFSSNTVNNGGISARSMNGPVGIFSDNKRLFLTDQSNNWILIWNHIPTTNFAPADIVLGQPDFTSNTANNGGVSGRSLNSPRNIVSVGKKILVADASNNRLLIYNLSGSTTQQDPQFEQGKAVVGKVFNDVNGNGIQDDAERHPERSEGSKSRRFFGLRPQNDTTPEPGIEGVKVVSDTGIYALTDQDGKYHFPYIETGQRVLKLDPDTLPEGSTMTTDNPYKVTITKGLLTKVSFGVQLPEPSIEQSAESIGKPSILSSILSADLPLLQVSITQDTSSKPEKTLGITAEIIEDKIKFTTTCNYYLLVKESEILLYDQNQKPLKTLTLPQPIPLYYEIPLKDLMKKGTGNHPLPVPFLYYQLTVQDAQGHEDRTSVGKIEIE